MREEITGYLTQRLERLNTFGSRWVARKYSAASVAIVLHEPCEGVDHRAFGIARALEELDGMPVGCQFHGAAVVAGDQSSGDGCDGTATGKDFFQ